MKGMQDIVEDSASARTVAMLPAQDADRVIGPIELDLLAAYRLVAEKPLECVWKSSAST